jgi:hypothetical protein
MRRSFALFLAACGTSPHVAPDARALDARAVDAAGPDATDAPPDPLACLGQPAQASAPDPLPIAGKLFAIDHYQVTPVANEQVVVRSDTDTLATATTGADGAFAASVPSGGLAVSAHFTVDVDGFRPSVIWPGDPLHGGENALLVIATDAEIARWYADAGTTPSTAALIAATVDCDAQALGGTTIAVAPAPSGITYYDSTAQVWSPQLTASTNGFALVAAPDASVTVTASAGSIAFPPHAIAVAPGALTVAVVTPHL